MAVASLLLLACAAGGVRTGSDFDESVDLGSYRTFAWLEDPVLTNPNPEVSALTRHRIRTSIEETLIQKGFDLVDDPDEADFLMSFVVGTRERVVAESHPDVRFGRWGWCGPYCYDHEYVVRTYTQGTLSVDIFDARSEAPVWHGWARKTVTSADREDPRPAIKQAVEQLLADFPPPVS